MPKSAVIRPRIDTQELVSAAQDEPLSSGFFARPALTVARELLGKLLIIQQPRGRRIAWPITETEAYVGAHDLACHGRFGPTDRTAVMFGPAGHWYVYLIYGMYWMLNAVTDRSGVPAAVLIRGAGPADGPGKLTKQLGLDRRWNGAAIDPNCRLWVAGGGLHVPRRKVRRTPRIGVDYAGIWKDRPYRFVWTADD